MGASLTGVNISNPPQNFNNLVHLQGCSSDNGMPRKSQFQREDLNKPVLFRIIRQSVHKVLLRVIGAIHEQGFHP